MAIKTTTIYLNCKWLSLTAIFAGLLLCFASIAYAEEAKKRVSFAISGGASKGAYEAGLNWAVLTVLRREGGQQDVSITENYRQFVAASIAGASAGGTNSILSAIAWCARPETDSGIANRVDDNVFRNLWLRLDINNLLPATSKSKIYQPGDAVLARRVLVEEAKKLRSIWNKPMFRKNCRIPLGVTVTRVYPEQLKVDQIDVSNQRFTIPFEFRTHDDGTAGFYFNPHDYPRLLDYSMILIPYEGGVENYKINDQSIEDAVLTSAAFPVAFGRKRLQYCRIKTQAESDEQELELSSQSLEKTIVCPEGYDLSEAEFADGGLFDNLPIGLTRILAEENKQSRTHSLPVTYIYLDPNRTRYPLPQKKKFPACESDNPPKACEQMEHSFSSESHLLFGAMGTAQSYELYRELTSNTWAYNLSQISHQIADILKTQKAQQNCDTELPYFEPQLECSHGLRLFGRLLEISYNRIDVPITPPLSVKHLESAGLVSRCVSPEAHKGVLAVPECYVHYTKLRDKLAQHLSYFLTLLPEHNTILQRRLINAQTSIHNDRVIRVTSRGAPIIGEMLESFAAFLDFKFREYDYYVGVYDAVIEISSSICDFHNPIRRQLGEFRICRDRESQRLFNQLGLGQNPKARYVFALLAKWEFENQKALQFAYSPLPEEVRDMRIIHEASLIALGAEWTQSAGVTGIDSGEVQFFKYLKDNNFKPTPLADGSEPLLADIMEDPDLWGYELTRRFTDRLILLEREAKQIFSYREPDPDKRPESNSTILGGASFVLRSATYKYPEFDFSASTAPKDWYLRYIIPYELALDLAGGGIQFVWQPTWTLNKYNLLGIRGSIAFTKGIVGEDSHETRENYFSIGLDYTHLTENATFSSWGFTPSYFHAMRTPEDGDTGSFGGDVHTGILGNKMRFALGFKDYDNIDNSWYLLMGVTDIPGIIYWFTR